MKERYKQEWDQVSAMLDSYVGVYTKATAVAGTPDTQYGPDGPFMGNGLLYGFMSADRKTQTVYLSRGDLWQDHSRKEFDGQEYTAFGGITIGLNAEKTGQEERSEFRYEHDMRNAEVRARSEDGFQTRNWISAQENVLVTEIENLTDVPLEMKVQAWTAHANTAAWVEGDVMIAAKAGISLPSDHPNGQETWQGFTVNLAMASGLVGDVSKTVSRIDDHGNQVVFILEPGKMVALVSAIEGGRQEGGVNSYEDARRHAVDKLKTRLKPEVLSECNRAHREFWKSY